MTAGNSSPLNDGAAALLLGSTRTALARAGLEPLARISRPPASTASSRSSSGSGRSRRSEPALAKAGAASADVTTMELNEAFAAQSLACLAEWPELDPDMVNPHGGAIAIGHPLGCSGARLAGAVAHQLPRPVGRRLAALCIGVGQGLALTMER